MKILYSALIVVIVFASCKKVDINTAAPLRTGVSNTLQFRPAIKDKPSVQVIKITNKGVSAGFELVDLTGCMITDVIINAWYEVDDTDGKKIARPATQVSISKIDICAGQMLIKSQGLTIYEMNMRLLAKKAF